MHAPLEHAEFVCTGLPVSTTQVICGALFAIGIIEGAKGVNWRVFLKVCTTRGIAVLLPSRSAISVVSHI